MKRKPVTRASVKHRRLRDLFGEVPITRADVYAWLLVVVNLDPDSMRAQNYVQVYGVLDKIVAAMVDGTFDEITALARKSSRYRELVQQSERGVGSCGFVTGSGPAVAPQTLATKGVTSRGRPIKPGHQYYGGGLGNRAGVDPRQPSLLLSPPLSGLEPMKPLHKTPSRPKEVIARAKARERQAKKRRREVDSSMLRRLPGAIPPLSVMMEDIGLPSPFQLAAAMHVTPGTARRWMDADQAPQAVMFALFWITKWGMSAVACNARNDAVASAQLAAVRGREIAALQHQVNQVQRLADFGSANDPMPEIAQTVPTGAAYPTPQPETPLVFTSIRRAPCADSGRKRKSA